MADGFRINEEYAKNYNKWRGKEELQKLKDKYGDVGSEDEETSSSESEDEEAEGLTPQVERDWLRTLAALKSKDPRIYDKSIQFYHEDEGSSEEESKKSGKKKEKPVFLKDFERKVITEKGGKLEDESDDEDFLHKAKSLSYYEEQEQLKKSLKAAVDSESDEEDFLQARQKSREEQEKDEEDYLQWLKGQKKELGESKQMGVELDPLKNYWNKPDLDDREKFLRDYILNKGYKEDDDNRIPTYDEIVKDDVDLSEEDDILEKQEDFERKYNFRFEEPDEDFIKAYPRTLSDTLRRKDNKRAKKRQEIKERKKQEKEKKKEELKQLKNLKKREIMDKLEKIKQITGNESVGFSQKDFDGDFDPEEHDKLMQQVFNESYYGEEEAEGTKPVFSDEEDMALDENWDAWTGEDNTEAYYEDGATAYCEDPEFNMDADYNPEEDVTSGKKKKKRKSKFKEALQRQKPVFDPENKAFEDYFDEYYKLDYEDIIDDLPCRFKYRNVTANDFGLEVDEILKAREKELNAWVSLKKMSQYRSEEEEQFDVKCYKRKAQNKKHKILPSLTDVPHEGSEKSSKKIPTATTTLADIEQSSAATKLADNQQTSDHIDNLRSSEDDEADQTEQVESRETSQNTDLQIKQTGDNNLSKPSSGPKKKKKKKKMAINDTQTSSVITFENTPETKKHVSGDSKSETNTVKKTKKNKKRKQPTITDERLKAYGINPKRFKYMDKSKLQHSKK